MQLTDLQALYVKADNIAKKRYEWYERHGFKYMIASYFARISAFAFVAGGTVLPFTHCTFGGIFEHAAQAAVASLAIAGLLVLADQVFMLTNTWGRYASAKMRIKSLLEAGELEWEMRQKSLPQSGPVGDEQAKSAMVGFNALLSESWKVVETETSTWSSDIIKAMGLLQSRMDDQRKIADSWKAKPAELGAIQIHFKNNLAAGTEGTIIIGNESKPIQSPPGNLVFNGLMRAVHTVTILTKPPGVQQPRRSEVAVKLDSALATIDIDLNSFA